MLAVGVDNVFILADALSRTDEGTPLEHRMGLALAAAGPSITLAACAGALFSKPFFCACDSIGVHCSRMER